LVATEIGGRTYTVFLPTFSKTVHFPKCYPEDPVVE